MVRHITAVVFLASACAAIGHTVDSNAAYTDVENGSGHVSSASSAYTSNFVPHNLPPRMRRRNAPTPASAPAPATQTSTQPATQTAAAASSTTAAKDLGPKRITKAAYTLYFSWETKPLAVAGRCANAFSNMAHLVADVLPQFKPYPNKKPLDAGIEKRGAELLEQHRAAVKAGASLPDATATQDAAKVAIPDPKKPPKQGDKAPAPAVYPHIKGVQGASAVYNITKEPVAAFLRHPLSDFYLHHEHLNLDLSPRADYYDVQSLAAPFGKEPWAFRSRIVNLLIQRRGEYLISWGESKNHDLVRVSKEDVTKTEVDGKKLELKKSSTLPVEELTWQTYADGVGAHNTTSLRVVAAMRIVDEDFYAVMRENYKDADMVAGEAVVWKPADGKLFNRLLGTQVLASKVQMLTAHHGATGNRDIVSIVTSPGRQWADPWVAAIILGDAKPVVAAAAAAAKPIAASAPAPSGAATTQQPAVVAVAATAAAPAPAVTAATVPVVKVSRRKLRR